MSNPEATFDYEGVSGSLDFDAAGDVNGAIEIWRFNLSQRKVDSLGLLHDEAGVYTAPDLAGATDDAECAKIGVRVGSALGGK